MYGCVISLTWLFDPCSCIRWGFIFKSIILVSFLFLACPSALASEAGTGETLWFCWFSTTVSLGGWFCTLLVSPWSTGCEAGSSIWPGLSPGNYRTNKMFLRGILHNRRMTEIPISLYRNYKPQLSASIEDIFHAFFYHQHEQSCHIANTGNSHLPHSKRKLHICHQKENHKLEILLPNTKGIFLKNINSKVKSKKETCIPGAFSHMSQRGTSLGFARPTRTCRLASLLHMWTCHSH